MHYSAEVAIGDGQVLEIKKTTNSNQYGLALCDLVECSTILRLVRNRVN